jgi:hypothetical protein
LVGWFVYFIVSYGDDDGDDDDDDDDDEIRQNHRPYRLLFFMVLLFSFLEVVVRLFLCLSVWSSVTFLGNGIGWGPDTFRYMAGRTTFFRSYTHTHHHHTVSPPTFCWVVVAYIYIYICVFLSNIHSHSHTFIGTHTPSLEPTPSIHPKKSRWKDMKISFAVRPLLVTQHNLLVPMYRYTMRQPVQPGGMRWTSRAGDGSFLILS